MEIFNTEQKYSIVIRIGFMAILCLNTNAFLTFKHTLSVAIAKR